MKTLILAVVAVAALGGCIAVPVSGPGGYYGPSVGIYAAPPVVYYGGHYRGGHRHRR